MKIRRVAISRLSSGIVAALLLFCIGWIALQIISASLDAGSPWKRYLDNGIVSNLICTGLAIVAAAVFSLRTGLVLPRVVFRDKRNTFTANQLAQRFHLDPSVAPRRMVVGARKVAAFFLTVSSLIME
jgi:hypothetical protein